ncbi:MAG: DUF4129 domain-containing protein [Caldilineaceae bacterium]|nr:DUF4129 domain-containing protein [Caldilineaceae bacterium]
MSWRRWTWLNEGGLPLLITPILVIIVRLCWLWPWMELLRRWLSPSYPSPFLPIGSILLLFVGGAWLARAALARTRSLALARIWVAASGLVVVLALLWWQYGRGTYALWDRQWLWQVAMALTHWQVELPPQLLTLLIAAGIWLRSVLDGQQQLTREGVWRAFTTGVIALVLLILAGQLDPQGLPAYADRWMVALFAAGLSALALSSLELSRFTGFWETQKQPQLQLNRYWLVSVAFVIVGMLAIGLLLGALLSPETVASALSWVSVLLNWLGTIIGYLLQILVYLLFLVLTPLYEWIRDQLATAELPAPVQLPEFGSQFDPFGDQSAVQLSPLAAESLRWVGLAGLVVVILVVFALALRYFRSSRGDEVEETRETVFTSELLQDQLSSLWQSLLQRLPRARRDPYLSLEGEPDNRRAIRALYQALLARANALGFPRARAQTPIEYEAYLSTIYPGDKSAWRVMTDVYLDARYSLQTPSSEQVEQMRQAWERVQADLTAPGSTGPSEQSDRDFS